MALELHGAVTCVTGGARGIGLATARALVERGAHAVIGDVDVDLAREAAKRLGANAHAVHLDVCDPDSFARFLAEAERLGPLALLVNNAGIMRTGPFLEQDAAGQAREMAINLGGVVTGMRLALPGMVARKRGHVVNVASMAAKMSVPGASVYTATKSAVSALSRAVRAELRGTGVTITTILPAVVHTELTAGLDTRGAPAVGPEDVAREIVDSCRHARPEIPIPRWLAPIGTIQEALPESVGEFVKRVVGAQSRVTKDNDLRRAYQRRT